MDEKGALSWLKERVPVGDDCYLLDWPEGNLLITTDMLHRKADFPAGSSDFTIGWRSVAVSFSDIAAMGGKPRAVVIAYGNDRFEEKAFSEFFAGAKEVTQRSGARIVGGDLDRHDELTVVTTALGEVTDPVRRTGASPGELVAVTGTLGRTGAALRLFDRGETDRANELFQFEPKIETGEQLASYSTSMMDVSDGLARSLHQLSSASSVGFQIGADRIPFHPLLDDLADSEDEKRRMGIFTGEDFELVFTFPEQYQFEIAKLGATVIGEVVGQGVKMVDGKRTVPLEDEGYVH